MPDHTSRRGAPLRERDVRGWADEADVLIVGLGGAGVCAAIESAGAGADTLVLERASAGGGTTAVSDGMMYIGGGTPLQQACGFEDTTQDMLDYLMASVGPEPDEPRIRAYCEGSVEHYHWLMAQGVPFKAEFYPGRMLSPGEEGLTYSGNELVHPFRELARPAPRAHMPAKEGSTGAFLMQLLIEAAERAGARRRCDVRAEALVVDDDARVVGVHGVSAGEELSFRARRGVILCAGGFVENAEMVRRYAPELARARAHAATESDDGRGILMGMGAGGAAVRMHMASITLPFYPPKSLMQGIFVNAAAQRFMPEDVYQGRAGEICLLHQDGRVWLILDDESFERPLYAGGELAGVGETIAELEQEAGFPAGALRRTLEQYNEHAARGVDPVFHKAPENVRPLDRPPFAALDLSWDKAVYAAFTLGGLDTDVHARVLRPSGEPVPGLWAAGRTAASFSSPGYSSGSSVGEATFFGRVAGREAAAG